MNTHDFNELTESIRQAGQIRRGEMNASRRFVLEEPDVAVIRQKYGMSQEAFASLMGIRVATLRNWEQGRRKPHGPAKVLLTIADRQPDAILAALT
jgi:putative transcriptional regulator